MFDYKHVAIILPERLGDAIFQTPSIRLLKKINPQIEIDVIALSPLSAEVVENNPSVSNTHILPTREAVIKLAANYDVVLNVHNHSESRKYVEWLGINTITATPSPTAKHQSEHALDFVRRLLNCEVIPDDKRYTLYPTARNRETIASLLQERGVAEDHDILIGCHLGCHSIAKRGLKFWRPLTHPKAWSLENFLALEAALRNHDPRIRMVLTGSKSEQKMAEIFVKSAPSAINLIDKTSVLDLSALMDRLTLFVTSDTGALHVACERDIGIVALFGPTSPEITGPYPMRDNYRVLKAPTIEDIAVSTVFDTIVAHPAVVHEELKSSQELRSSPLQN